MLERFSSGAGRVVLLAEDEAQRLGHAHVGTEHLLLGLLADGKSRAGRALAACGATLDGARQKVADAVPADAGAAPSGQLILTDRARRVLERAGRLSLRQHDEHVETEHLLRSLLDVEGTAGQVLRGLGIDLAGLVVALDTLAGAEVAAGQVVPRCGACGAGLDPGLAHRVVTSRPGTPAPQRFLVAYCAACGAALGATALSLPGA